MIRRGAIWAAAAAALAALAGCGPQFDHLDFQPETTPPLSVSLLSSQVTLPVGIAVGFDAAPMTDSGPIEDTHVDLLTSNGVVLGLDRTIDDKFVMFGVSVGEARIDVFLDGEQVGAVPVQVTPQ